MNPFKFGTIVDGPFFTDREEEYETIVHKLDSENHLILISPRRYGKSSLVNKVLTNTNRPYIILDLQQALSTQSFAEMMLKAIFELYPAEKIRHQLSHFRIFPTISTNAVLGTMEVSFAPATNESVILEDVVALLEKVSSPDKRLIVVLDEFQEVLNIQKGLDRQLRALMQRQQGINYIFMGSQESMMAEIFEDKKSPFYHFGTLMHLNRIPESIFKQYVFDRLPDGCDKTSIVDAIFNFAHSHPYYTQQLSAQVWELVYWQHISEDVVEIAILQQVQEHDLDYERIWNNLNRTDRGVISNIVKAKEVLTNRINPTSTTYSSLKRLLKSGIIVREQVYDIEDPFFKYWLVKYLN